MPSVTRISAAVVAALLLLLAGCADEFPSRHMQPLSYRTLAELKLRGMSPEAPILIRIFKNESVLEVWKRRPDGHYDHFKDYEICKWSGEFGPKIKEGDRQAPEGFYSVKPVQMNPWSKYYLSFNLGYPNVYDQSYGRTGKHLMVHGACSSAGCYSMTDDLIAEIYALVREAHSGGQEAVQIQAYPFRLTEENLQRYSGNRWYDFWLNLKEGYDAFERDQVPPRVTVCGRRYHFNATFLVPEDQINPSDECPPRVNAEGSASGTDSALPRG